MSTALGVTQLAPACTEHELVAAVRRGSDQAFEELFSRYRDRIGAYVLGLVGDHGRAEDIAQEVFISALRRLRETDRQIAFRPWIYEIAKNACIDEFRRTRRVQEVPLDTDQQTELGTQRLVAQSASPDAAVEGKQRLDDLRGAFGGLSESHHKVLVMRELAGLSYDQIGRRMGMSTPVVESTLFRARRRLGQEYDELVSGRRCEHVQSVIATDGERPLRALGLRERRQLGRHLAHCQPCRRHARMAGIDDSFFQTPSLIGKIAALLPFPWLRWRRSRGDDKADNGAGAHQLSAARSLQTAAQYVDPGAPALSLGRAAATVAAIVIAGAGGGFATGLGAKPDHLGSRGAGLLPSNPAGPSARSSSSGAPGHHGLSSQVRGAGVGQSAPRGPTSGAGAAPPAGHAGTARAAAGQAPAGGSAPRGGPVSGTATAGKPGLLGSLHLPLSKPGAPAGGSPLPKLPGVKLPSVPSLTGIKPPSLPLPSLPQVKAPSLPQVKAPPPPGVGLPPLPQLPLPNPSGLVPPLGHGGH